MKSLKILTSLAILSILSAFAINNLSFFSNGYQVGDSVEDFSLKNVDGKMVSLRDFEAAKGFIVVFTCNTCPFAIANEDRVIALDKKYKSQGYPVIAINPNSPEAQPGDSFVLMQKRAKDKGFTFPYLMDEGQKVYPKYGATKTPHVYIVKKEGADLVVKYIGAIDDSVRDAGNVDEKFAEKALDELIKGKEVSVPTTKAIGCTIKV